MTCVELGRAHSLQSIATWMRMWFARLAVSLSLSRPHSLSLSRYIQRLLLLAVLAFIVCIYIKPLLFLALFLPCLFLRILGAAIVVSSSSKLLPFLAYFTEKPETLPWSFYDIHQGIDGVHMLDAHTHTHTYSCIHTTCGKTSETAI